MLKKKLVKKIPKLKLAPKRIIFFPYNMGSEGCAALSKALGGLKVFPDKNYVPKQQHTIVNWGNSQTPKWMPPFLNGRFLNRPLNVGSATNKLHAFKLFQHNGVSIPEFVTNLAAALKWAQAGETVICRKTLTGSEGKGIVVITQENNKEMPVCQLYTLYKKKKQEFRVHVLGDKVIDVQEKRRVKDAEKVDSFIRNHDNGWVFCRDGVNMPKQCGEEAVKAIKALGLDFGGVDVIYNAKEDKAYVLEVNTAPGLEGTTVTKYATAFKAYFIQKGWL